MAEEGIPCPGHLAAGVETAMGLVRCLESRRAACSKVWREWEEVVSFYRASKTCLLYFIRKFYSLGVSPSGMSRRLSAMAFWFKVSDEKDFTKSFLVRWTGV